MIRARPLRSQKRRKGVEGGMGPGEMVETQGAQYPLIKEYTLDHIMKAPIV